MADPRHAEDDLETLRAIAEGQGIDPGGMTAEQLAATLREAGVAEGPPGGAHLLDPDDEGRPVGEYAGQGVGRREAPGGPVAAPGTGTGPDVGPDTDPGEQPG